MAALIDITKGVVIYRREIYDPNEFESENKHLTDI